MKAYALFAGENYYPSGGAGDFVGYFDSHQLAIDHAEQLEEEWRAYQYDKKPPKHSTDWWHVAETATMEVVAAKK
jgi:hypothetical protein